ncbi:hypothetical protein M8C21_020442 [Ambrosia artemisiifolia]|uniref:Uncharacterized protein n=1 Tax=Ambrosia artemisiifolia TaxID=4212 RepID=A0AAD5G430_AMBAR|nr:hypothetical protein M8C21_020442 [Ambrosia artemisiifolia]
MEEKQMNQMSKMKVQDKRMKLAFFTAMSNIVVAKDKDQYGPDKEFRRVVTLDAVLIEKSRTLSRGGKPRGEELTNVRQQISEMVRHYKGLEKQNTDPKLNIAKSQQEAAAVPSKAELTQIEELQKKEIKSLTNGSNFKVSELRSKIKNAGGERLKSQKLKVTKIKNVSTVFEVAKQVLGQVG